LYYTYWGSIHFVADQLREFRTDVGPKFTDFAHLWRVDDNTDWIVPQRVNFAADLAG